MIKKNKNGKIAIAQILVLVMGIIAFNFQLGGVSAATPTCTEDDGGDNPDIKGTTTGKYSTGDSFSKTDYCVNTDKLYEYSCPLNGIGVNQIPYFCGHDFKKICKDGACVKETATTTSSTDCLDDFNGACIEAVNCPTGTTKKLGATGCPGNDICCIATTSTKTATASEGGVPTVEDICTDAGGICKISCSANEGSIGSCGIGKKCCVQGVKSTESEICESKGGRCSLNVCLTNEVIGGSCKNLGTGWNCCFPRQIDTSSEAYIDGYNDGKNGADKNPNIVSTYKDYGEVDYDAGYKKGQSDKKVVTEPSQGTAINPTENGIQLVKDAQSLMSTGISAVDKESEGNYAFLAGRADYKTGKYQGASSPDPVKYVEGWNSAWADEHPQEVANGVSKDPSISDAAGIAGTAKSVLPKTAKVGFWSSAGYGQIIKNAGWATGIYLGLKTILPMVGASKSFTDASSTAIGWGYFAGKTVAWGIAKYGAGATVAHTTAGGTVVAAKAGTVWGIHMGAATAGLIIGVAIAISIFAFSYKDTKTEKYIFNCEPWQANTGGSKCEECNKQGVLGCNEYQCRSLGQSCEIINAGTSEEKCAWVNKNDVKTPEITVANDALLKDYTYNPTAAVSPPDRGVKIDYNSADKCVPAFTAFTFGINTNEPARCKIDYERKNNFDDMSFFFGGSNYLLYNHTQFMSLPGSSSLGEANLSLTGAGNYDLYVKCQDSNGNANTADFVFKFCVDKGPDATPPLVVTTSIPSGNPVQFGTQKTPLEIYTNEPAICKWSIRDQDYSTMENEMSCSQNVEDMNTAMLYTCETTLTDLQNKEDNTFYFRCQDTSPQKNTNTESYKFILKGSRELVIDSVGPTNKTIKGSTESVPVTLTAKTSFGFNEGVATCQYSETDEAEKYVDFFETHSYAHSQVLVLKQGTYKYYIKCFDIAGNSDTETISFTVEADPYAPVITRIYREGTNLKLVTNKKSSCVYTTFGCSYDTDKDGTKIATSDGITHLIGWETRTQFYIKCVDESKNKPLANECSVIVKPLDI